jgi:carbonic anhydrase
LTFVISAAAGAQTWNHDPGSSDGPAHWSATCATGTKQTPIDIASTSVKRAKLPSLEFHYLPTHLAVKNLTHVIEVENEAESSALSVGSDQYHLVQFHFHTPSEHTIDGRAAKMELHFVHRNAAGALAVVGVMLSGEGAANPLFDRIFTNAPAGPGTSPALGEINPTQLLPADRSYYTYGGSLTTPPCTEGVQWFVLTHPAYLSSAAVDKFEKVLAGNPGNNQYSHNNRPVQGLNGRTVQVSR